MRYSERVKERREREIAIETHDVNARGRGTRGGQVRHLIDGLLTGRLLLQHEENRRRQILNERGLWREERREREQRERERYA